MNAEAAIQEQAEQYLELRRHWRDDPVLYARQRLGLRPTWQQRQLLESLAPDGAKVTVRSGHGTGKTAAEGAAILWFLETRPYSKAPCTAATSAQLRDVLWAEIAKWIRQADAVSKEIGLVERLWLGNLFRTTRERVYDPSAPAEWYAVARTSGRDNPDALQGFHATNLTVDESGTELEASAAGGHILFIIEEASGVYEKVFEVAEGALSSSDARLLMCGNPTRNTGYFARSHKQDRAEFTALHFRTQDSPLAAADYRDRLVRRWGEGSNIVRVRADGEFPAQEDDVLISLEDAEACISREPHELSPADTRRLGIDVARYGDDRTVLCYRAGRNVYEMSIHAQLATTEVAGLAVQLYHRLQPREICVDTIGIGAGVADQLRDQGYPVLDVDVSRAAPARAHGDTRPQGRTMRDYLWLTLAEWLHHDEPSFRRLDEDHAQELTGELCSVKYQADSQGRIVVEGKDAMKRRGLQSPDLADALAATFWPGTAQGPRVASAGRRTFGTDGGLL